VQPFACSANNFLQRIQFPAARDNFLRRNQFPAARTISCGGTDLLQREHFPAAQSISCKFDKKERVLCFLQYF
jgi:hypothetical protein